MSLQNRFCACCLDRGFPLVNLSTCNHVWFLNNFFEYKLSAESYVCSICHSFLKKAELFKRQVEESIELLNAQVLKSPSKYQTLKKATLETLSNEINSQEYFSLSSRSSHNNCSERTFKTDEESFHDTEDLIPTFTVEFTNDNDSNNKSHGSSEVLLQSDTEDEKPLVELKKNKTRKKSNRNLLQDRYKGKYNVIEMSREEVLKEREIERKKETFLKLQYRCDFCIVGFDHEAMLSEHNTKKHTKKENGFQCDICQSVCSTKGSFLEHSKRHTRRFECAECGIRFGNPYSILEHYRRNHGEVDSIHTCHCGYTTQCHAKMRYHRSTHKGKPTCTICDSSFANNSSLKVHMFTIHKQSSRVYSCTDGCGKSFASRSGLSNHACTAAARRRLSAACALCRTTYSSRASLRNHLRTHSRHAGDHDHRVVCDECGAKFLSKSALRQHIVFVHIKNFKHECPKCAKVFPLPYLLKKHVNFVHEKKRPPRNKICDHCGKAFTTLQILSAHVRTHTGERPLACGACPATFAHSGALYTHTRLVHRQ